MVQTSPGAMLFISGGSVQKPYSYMGLHWSGCVYINVGM